MSTNASEEGLKEKPSVSYEPVDVELVKDIFGIYYDENGETHNIERFTWKNKNKIQVQVISYGARIISMKMPDRSGCIDDIVLGFNDLAGYVHYKNKYFGATIGRMTNIVKNSTFVIYNKQYYLHPNHNVHHFNGGRVGLDQVVWTTFMDYKRVIMSHVSPHMSEGYPGDLLVRIIFELSPRNEFNIIMEAQCTRPTIVNLSNLLYFNLAGHHSGPHEIYKHVVTLNCNCFTPQNDGIPTGETINVIHSGFDFQIPKVLGKVMGIVPKDGFNQNLCVNRGMGQENCFIARVLHPPSGRLLEVYSNQMGVNFSTANDFGYDDVMSMEELIKSARSSTASPSPKPEAIEPLLNLYEKIHQEVKGTLTEEEEENTFKELYDLIKKMKELGVADAPNNTPAESIDGTIEQQNFSEREKKGFLIPTDLQFTQTQMEYMNTILRGLWDEENFSELKEALQLIVDNANKMKDESITGEEKNKIEKGSVEGKYEKSSERKSVTSSQTGRSKKKVVIQNFIPDYYRLTNKIIGKDRAHYKTHGGIALQTQNYPGCANYKNFPSCMLKPGDTYSHSITYKFWIRAGNPSKWIKRNLIENRAEMR